MLDKKSDISRIIDHLYEKKLIERKECPQDRRQKDINITKQGLELLSQMDECEKKVDTLLKNLSQQEVKQLNIMLDKIREK